MAEIMTADEYVGDAVHRLVWRRRLQHQDVAEKAGISAPMFSRKLRGSARWHLDEVLRIADVLDVELVDLLPPKDEKWEKWAPRGSNPEPTD